MGTSEFANPILELLAQSPHRPVLVVSQPDRPAGRGRRTMPPPIKDGARRANVPMIQPESVSDPATIDAIREAAPDLIVVAAYGQKLPKALLDLPKHACLNVHASLLPKYRGASPVAHAILDGCTETGVTIQLMNEKIDAGKILAQQATPIEPLETCGELTTRLAKLGAALLVETIGKWVGGELKPFEQDHKKATTASKLVKGSGAIDWSDSGVDVKNFVRAMTPRPGAFAYLSRGGQTPDRVQILRVETSELSDGSDTPGTIVWADRKSVAVACGKKSAVTVTRIKQASGRDMAIAEYLKGHPVLRGDLFAPAPPPSAGGE
jgi:methionyl-tRNA formyltransferase